MPDKPLTIATYAAGASLAAITLVYVFGPTFFIDGEASNSRKRYAVGLVNTANDCFINSALQALAGLADFRLYLIRETHRRKLDGEDIYAQIVQDATVKGMSEAKIEGLQRGIVTFGMKEMLDALNERPISKKSISPQPFISSMEAGYRTRISRQQQDAHEFLVLVAERMCDEYHAGHRARKHARKSAVLPSNEIPLQEANGDKHQSEPLTDAPSKHITAVTSGTDTSIESGDQESAYGGTSRKNSLVYEDEDGFPLEGACESQIECQTCGFKPKSTESTFAILTLSVPQVSSTSLNSCFDDVFKTEVIDDFKCDKCRLVHCVETLRQDLKRSPSEDFKSEIESTIQKVQNAIDTNPEEELSGIQLPDSKFAPRRRIKKHNRITKFPKVLAIHLSRSIFDVSSATMKNSAKISFEERLTLGGLLNRRVYRLSSVICHKGSHGSGHYESFRRQAVMSPFSTPNVFGQAGVYSRQATPSSSQVPSEMPTPQIKAVQKAGDGATDRDSSTPEPLTPTMASSSSVSIPLGRSSDVSQPANGLNITGALPSPMKESDGSSLRSLARSARVKAIQSDSNERPSTPTRAKAAMNDIIRGKRKTTNKWWRISDSKVKECKTSDLLGMQKEVYMLFYELVKDEDATK